MKCKICRFWEALTVNPQKGYCHESPPSSDGKNFHTVDEQPVVRDTNWCGKFKKKGKK